MCLHMPSFPIPRTSTLPLAWAFTCRYLLPMCSALGYHVHTLDIMYTQCTLDEALSVVAARQAAAKEQLQEAEEALVKLRAHVAMARVGVQGLEMQGMLGAWAEDGQ